MDQAQGQAMRTSHKARELLAQQTPSLRSTLKTKNLMDPRKEDKRDKANLYQAN